MRCDLARHKFCCNCYRINLYCSLYPSTFTHYFSSGYQGLDRNGWTVWYAIRIKAAQKMKQGDLGGYVGSTAKSTAPHVHHEIREKGKNVNPQKFLQGRS